MFLVGFREINALPSDKNAAGRCQSTVRTNDALNIPGTTLMTCVPIIGRELRVAARRPGTYWTRLVTGAVSFALLLWGLVTSAPFTSPANIGGPLFSLLAAILMGFCILAGVLITSDCLSQEKREGTLGLLFLTDLRGYDVVLGKLTATSLRGFYGLLATLPVLAIPLTIGGVTVGEFWRMALALINALFFSLSAGLLVSALSRLERTAMAGTFLLVSFFGFVLPVTYDLLTPTKWGAAAGMAKLFSPLAAQQLANETAFKAAPYRFWWALLGVQSVSWLFLFLASAVVPASWQEKATGGFSAKWQPRWRQLRHGAPGKDWSRRRRLLQINPLLWLGSRDRLPTVYLWFVLTMIAGGWWIGLLKVGQGWFEPAACIGTMIAMHGMLKFWVASEASRRFAEDRRSGALELLLSTPLSVKEIIAGHLLAMKRRCLGPAAVILLADAGMLILSRKAYQESSDPGYGLFCLGGMVLLIADAYALAWTGFWLGLKFGWPSRATFSALARVLAVPSGILTVLVLAGGGQRAELIFFWILVKGMVDFGFAVVAARNLNESLRVLATNQKIVKAAPDYSQDYSVFDDPRLSAECDALGRVKRERVTSCSTICD
jgi:ABC-type transport system involved in cytochrome c biogenesis permease component